MSESMFFMVNGECYGVILALVETVGAEPIAYLPQGLAPAKVETYQHLTPEQMWSYVDEVCTIWPTLEGAQQLMQFLYTSIEMDMPNTVIAIGMENMLDAFGGQFTTKTDLNPIY